MASAVKSQKVKLLARYTSTERLEVNRVSIITAQVLAGSGGFLMQLSRGLSQRFQ